VAAAAIDPLTTRPAVTATYEKGVLTVEVPLPTEVIAAEEKVTIDVIEK
jgi:HSP20 family molecular chaperone IbpA